MQVNRMILITLALFASALAQTATLTPGQAAAIKAEETRYNTVDLANFPYASITFTLDSINDPPPKKTVITGTPQPGMVAVRVIENLLGGKQPAANQGYRPVTYWLVPLGGDTWKAEPEILGDIYPTSLAAHNTFHPKEAEAAQRKAFVHSLPTMLTAVGGLILLPVFLVLLRLIVMVPALRRREVVESIVCPGCKTEVRPQASSCANCGSVKTRLVKAVDRKGYGTISTYCRECFRRTQFDPYCPVDEVNLTAVLLKKPGRFRFASLFERIK